MSQAQAAEAQATEANAAAATATKATPPWVSAQARQLLAQKGHAWLLHGPSGVGQYRLALALATAWLCEAPTDSGACGTCPGCHAVQVRTHADLRVLMPEVALLDLGWPLAEKAQEEIDKKERKPSREIRVDAMRDAIEFSQRTSARGRGKVVLVYPAEQMNTISANALLKTLEEPPGAVRFVLASESAHQLLPTIRSRCLGHAMHWPEPAVALGWLQQQGIEAAAAPALLQAAGGRPEDALLMRTTGRSAEVWARFPAAMAAGNAAFVRDWPVTELVDALQKLCHDALCIQQQAVPRYFALKAAPAKPGANRSSMTALTDWFAALQQSRKTMEHPFILGLMQEALVEQARQALNPRQ
ncbi:MAG: DNA polymerase III subunit delta' [Rhodoferax sp.]|nr:DNA polymerase III subunit delta' [Rhodoferax sp.]